MQKPSNMEERAPTPSRAPAASSPSAAKHSPTVLSTAVPTVTGSPPAESAAPAAQDPTLPNKPMSSVPVPSASAANGAPSAQLDGEGNWKRPRSGDEHARPDSTAHGKTNEFEAGAKRRRVEERGKEKPSAIAPPHERGVGRTSQDEKSKGADTQGGRQLNQLPGSAAEKVVPSGEMGQNVGGRAPMAKGTHSDGTGGKLHGDETERVGKQQEDESHAGPRDEEDGKPEQSRKSDSTGATATTSRKSGAPQPASSQNAKQGAGNHGPDNSDEEGPLDLAAMSAFEYEQVAKLTPAQTRRYEQYRRSDLKTAKVRKVLIALNPLLQKASEPYVIAVKGLAKLFVGDVVETANEVRRAQGESGALQPKHLREAYRRLRRSGVVPGPHQGGFSFS